MREQFISDVKIIDSDSNWESIGRVNIKWNMSIETTTWGVWSLSASVPAQSIDVEYEVYNDITGEEELKQVTIILEENVTKVEDFCLMPAADIAPLELELSDRKWTLHFKGILA